MTMQKPTPFIQSYKIMGEMICQHINAKKNQKARKEIACNLVRVLCDKIDDMIITEVSKEIL